jgi:hypothetical protein
MKKKLKIVDKNNNPCYEKELEEEVKYLEGKEDDINQDEQSKIRSEEVKKVIMGLNKMGTLTHLVTIPFI